MTDTVRVQRVPDTWPVVHLESSPPAWDGLELCGQVVHARSLTLAGIASLGPEEREIDFHCVWGWSRPRVRWVGVGFDRVLDVCGPTGSHVTLHAAGDDYSSCMPLDVAARGFLAWERDGAPIPADEGGPLRFVPPPELWAYKGVKWVARAVVGDRFVPGFWESRIGDPVGTIPDDVVRP